MFCTLFGSGISNSIADPPVWRRTRDSHSATTAIQYERPTRPQRPPTRPPVPGATPHSAQRERALSRSRARRRTG